MENFIYEDYLEDVTICDLLIEHFKNSEFKGPGVIGSGVDPTIKSSLDCRLEGDILESYMNALQKIAYRYIEKFPWCNKYAPWGLLELPNIQYYAPGQAFYGWHTERSAATYPIANRHLAFLTYLNDVTDQGGTEFIHQNIITTPKKGKTIVWPADWTYTHRGIPSPTQDKYIVAGWYSFLN